MSDRDLLEKLADHFAFLKRLAEAPYVRQEGKTVPKWKAVAAECEAARVAILGHFQDPTV